MPMFLRRALIILLLAGMFAQVHAAGISLDCPDTGKEAVAMAAMHGKVVRHGKHELLIQTQAGLVRLKDEPPYDEELSGTKYSYLCMREGFYIVSLNTEGLFTGVLVRDKTGKILPGGQTVMLSPDRSEYFISQQPDGLDGAEWMIYSMDGKRLWSGYSFTTRRKTTELIGDYLLENPSWGKNNTIKADVVCASNVEMKKWVATLNPADSSWQPLLACPPQKP